MPAAPCWPGTPAHSGLESALARLRELEREQQQLEARVNDLQEENLELSTEVCVEAAVMQRKGMREKRGPPTMCWAATHTCRGVRSSSGEGE